MPERNQLKAFKQIHRLLKQATEFIVNSKSYPLAEKLVISILRLDPDNPNAYFLYGLCLAQRQNNEKAQQMRKIACRNNYFYRNVSEQGMEMVKSLASASNNVLKQIDKDSNEKETRWAEVINGLARSKDAYSTEYAIKASQIDCDFLNKPAVNYPNYGLNLYEVGMYEHALRYYQNAIQGQSNQYRYHNNSAIILCIFKRYQQAENYIVSSFVLKPGYFKTMFIYSFALAKTGRHNDALRNIQDAVKKEPISTMCLFRLVTLLLEHYPNNHEETHEQLKKLQEIIKQKKDKDDYFFCPDNIPLLTEAAQFLLDNHSNQDIDRVKFHQYVGMMEEYLIRGHTDKFRLTSAMRALRCEIEGKPEPKQLEHKPIVAQPLVEEQEEPFDPGYFD